MHELGLTQDLVQAITTRVGSAQVTRVTLELGALSGVSPDALRFCFELCVQGTHLEGAEIEVVEIPGKALCRACGGPVELDRFFGYCACGSSDLEWHSGDGLAITGIVLAPQP